MRWPLEPLCNPNHINVLTAALNVLALLGLHATLTYDNGHWWLVIPQPGIAL